MFNSSLSRTASEVIIYLFLNLSNLVKFTLGRKTPQTDPFTSGRNKIINWTLLNLFPEGWRNLQWIWWTPTSTQTLKISSPILPGTDNFLPWPDSSSSQVIHGRGCSLRAHFSFSLSWVTSVLQGYTWTSLMNQAIKSLIAVPNHFFHKWTTKKLKET